MEEKRIEVTENEELLKEEVDIYELPDCDIVRKKCENDCIGGGAFLIQLSNTYKNMEGYSRK